MGVLISSRNFLQQKFVIITAFRALHLVHTLITGMLTENGDSIQYTILGGCCSQTTFCVCYTIFTHLLLAHSQLNRKQAGNVSTGRFTIKESQPITVSFDQDK